jgi:hypothetical protein
MDNNCPDCEKLRLDAIKTGSLISTLKLTVNQLTLQLKKEKEKTNAQ